MAKPTTHLVQRYTQTHARTVLFLFKKETKVSDTVTIFYVSMGALRI